MNEMCIKKIACDRCPNESTCAMKKQEDLYKALFTRYGHYIEETSEKVIRLYEYHPNNLHTEKDVLNSFERAKKDIESLENYILQLKAYQNALTERYNFIKTSPVKKKIRLHRERRWKSNIFYFIEFYDVNLNDGHEELTHSIKYTGKERRDAIKHFEQLQKEKKDTIFEKDIELARWER